MTNEKTKTNKGEEGKKERKKKEGIHKSTQKAVMASLSGLVAKQVELVKRRTRNSLDRCSKKYNKNKWKNTSPFFFLFYFFLFFCG